MKLLDCLIRDDYNDTFTFMQGIYIINAILTLPRGPQCAKATPGRACVSCVMIGPSWNIMCSFHFSITDNQESV